MIFKREILISLFILSSALCAQLYAQRYTLSVIRTAEPVKTITWNKDGSYFAYAEKNNIIMRSTNGYQVVHHIATYKSDINFLSFSANTAGLANDQLATLHESGILDFRILPDITPTMSLETENSEPTVMTYSYNGNYFAVGNKNGTVLLYQQNYLTQTAITQQVGNLGVPITSLHFSRDNKYLLIGAADNSVTVIEVASRKIVNGYAYNAKNKVPIIMTADSKSIIMTTGDSTIGFFDLEFNRFNYYTTYRDILSLHLSADNRFLIILTDDNVFSYYDLQTHEIKKYIPAFNETKILTYAFDVNCSKLAVSHEDGSLYVLDVNAVLLDKDQTRNDYTITEQAENINEFDFSNKEIQLPPAPQAEPKKEEPQKAETPKVEPKKETEKTEPKKEPAKTVEPPKPEEKTPAQLKKEERQKKAEEKKAQKEQKKIEKETKKVAPKERIFDDIDIKTLFKDGHGVVVDVGSDFLLKPETSRFYINDFKIIGGYYNYNLIQPFYFGGIAGINIAMPSRDFPYEYNDSNGKMQEPFLTGIKAVAPIGISIYPMKNSLEIYAELNAGVILYKTWNGGFFNSSVAGKFYPSFVGGLKIGAAWDFINLSICGNFDPIEGMSIGIEIGALINIGGTRTIGSLVQVDQ